MSLLAEARESPCLTADAVGRQGTHKSHAEMGASRTHLPTFKWEHAALKAGRDTGPHPPPYNTRLQENKRQEYKNTRLQEKRKKIKVKR